MSLVPLVRFVDNTLLVPLAGTGKDIHRGVTEEVTVYRGKVQQVGVHKRLYLESHKGKV